MASADFKTLILKIPSDFEFDPSEIAEMLQTLHPTLSHPLAFEANVLARKLFFSVRVREDEKPIIENQLYTTFPSIEIDEVENPMSFNPEKTARGEIIIQEGDYFPIETFEEQKSSLFIKFLSQTSDLELTDKMIFQIVLEHKNTHNIFFQFLRRFKYRIFMFRKWFDFRQRWLDNKVNVRTKKAREAFQGKNKKDLYYAKLRFYLQSSDYGVARAKTLALLKNFADFENNINAIKYNISKATPGYLKVLDTPSMKGKKYLMSIEEVATLYQFPDINDKMPHILRILSKKARPPIGLPSPENTDTKNLVLFGRTNYRNQRIDFGLKTADKARHLYVVGKSGSGKSKLLELLCASDIQNGRGFAILDPHGDVVDGILSQIPEERMKDVVVFDPTDLAFPVGFNPIEEVPEEYRQEFTNSFLEIFAKLFGEAWNARLEHVMRFCVLALLEVGNATVLSIIKLLTDRDYRQSIIKKLEDQTVKNFWTNEFAAWSEKYDSEAIMPVLNKVAQFVSSPMIRNIVCQVDNKMNLIDIMDNKKIFLVKLSKGQLGEVNANLIGAMLITRMYQAALMRADTPEDKRTPFSLYIDEFQNFATDTFENILSEVRKYKVNITVAHQYMGQLTPTLRKTIFGNVANIISFRVGAEDAAILADEYAPIFTVPDIMNLGVREMYLKMNVDGENTEAFSARSLDVRKVQNDLTKKLLAYSQQTYARPRKEVEDIIFGRDEDALEVINELKQDEDFDTPMI